MGEDLHVDTGLVHLLEPQLAEVVEALEHLWIARALGADELGRDLLVPVVLLDRDHRAFRPLQHDVLPPFRWLPAVPNRLAGICQRAGSRSALPRQPPGARLVALGQSVAALWNQTALPPLVLSGKAVEGSRCSNTRQFFCLSR
jgi:hypothetical protein